MKFTSSGGNTNSKITLTERYICDGIIEIDVKYELSEKAIPQVFFCRYGSTLYRCVFRMESCYDVAQTYRKEL